MAASSRTSHAECSTGLKSSSPADAGDIQGRVNGILKTLLELLGMG